MTMPPLVESAGRYSRLHKVCPKPPRIQWPGDHLLGLVLFPANRLCVALLAVLAVLQFLVSLCCSVHGHSSSAVSDRCHSSWHQKNNRKDMASNRTLLLQLKKFNSTPSLSTPLDRAPHKVPPWAFDSTSSSHKAPHTTSQMGTILTYRSVTGRCWQYTKTH